MFWGKKVRKIEEKCWKNPKKEKNEEKNSPKFGFSPVHQMSLDSPLSWTLIAVQKNGKLTAGLMSQESSRTDPYSPIFGHIKVLHFLMVF